MKRVLFVITLFLSSLLMVGGSYVAYVIYQQGDNLKANAVVGFAMGLLVASGLNVVLSMFFPAPKPNKK